MRNAGTHTLGPTVKKGRALGKKGGLKGRHGPGWQYRCKGITRMIGFWHATCFFKHHRGVIDMPSNELLIEILKDQVKPALGCTEPGAVAYAVARAKELLGTEVEKLSIRVDKNILKNGMDVGIPGTSERGIVFAAALSLAAGKSEYVLEVLKDVNSDSIEKAHDITNSGMIELDLDKDADGLYISVEAKGGKDRARW